MSLRNGLTFARGTDRFHSLRGIYYGEEQLNLEQFADLRASLRGSPEVQVENPYRKGHYLDGFALDLLSGAVLHRNIGSLAASSYLRLQPLAVLWEGSEIGDRVSIGSFAEVRKRACLHERASLRGGSVLCRDGRLEEDVHVLEGTYLASEIRVQPGSTIGAMNYFRTGCRVDTGVYTENGVYCGERVHLNPGCILEADVKVASFSAIGRCAVVGEAATIGIVDYKRPTGYVSDFEVVPPRAILIHGVNYARPR